MIKSIRTISSDRIGDFNDEVIKVVNEFQNKNLEVEIQYNTSTFQDINLIYSALILGKEKNNINIQISDF